MNGCLRMAARISAVGLATVFVVTLPLAVIGFSLARVAFSPERLTVLVTETIVESGGLRRLMLESLTAGTEAGDAEAESGLDLGEALSFLSPQERDYLGEQLTPPGWGEEQLHALLGGLFAWIDNDRAGPELAVDVTALKVSLLGGGAAELVETMVDSWPPCSLEEVAQMGVETLLGEGEFILCEPPEPLRTGLVGVLNVSVAVSLRALPDRISLGGPAARQAATPEAMEAKGRIRALRLLAEWGWLLSVALLALVLALVVRSWRSLGLWWGVPLLLGAGLTLLVTTWLRAALGNALTSSLTGGEIPVWIGDILRKLAEGLLQVTSRGAAVLSGILLAGGLAVLGGGLWLRRARPPEPAHPSEATTRILEIEDEPEPPATPPSGMFG